MKVLGLADAATAYLNVVKEVSGTIWSGLAELNGRGLEDEMSGLIRVNRNQIECDILYDDWGTGPALCLFGQAQEKKGACDVTANFMTTRNSHLTVGVLGISEATVNGNTVIGLPYPDTALGVIAIPNAAITGNVVRGQLVLPATRPFPPPLEHLAAAQHQLLKPGRSNNGR
jgi:hypothetical protein